MRLLCHRIACRTRTTGPGHPTAPWRLYHPSSQASMRRPRAPSGQRRIARMSSTSTTHPIRLATTITLMGAFLYQLQVVSPASIRMDPEPVATPHTCTHKHSSRLWGVPLDLHLRGTVRDEGPASRGSSVASGRKTNRLRSVGLWPRRARGREDSQAERRPVATLAQSLPSSASASLKAPPRAPPWPASRAAPPSCPSPAGPMQSHRTTWLPAPP